MSAVQTHAGTGFRAKLGRALARIKTIPSDRSGLALIEFAYSMPILLAMGMSGTELANYATAKLRVSQMALGIADHSSRFGEDGVLKNIKIYESDINDVFVGANLQSGTMNLAGRGRVYLTSLQEDSTSGSSAQISKWRRCYGALNHSQVYTVNSSTGMGPASDRVKAAAGTSVMFAEVAYEYEFFFGALSKLPVPTKIIEIAAFTVRDDRDLTAVYSQPGVAASAC